MNSSEINVYFNKKKLLRNLLGCVVFVLIGLWILLFKSGEEMLLHGLPIKLQWLGTVTLLFFGVILLFLVKKAFSNEPALTIDDLGLQDRSSLFSAGYFLWKDIAAVSILEIRGQKMIIIKLSDPKSYIQSQTNLVKKLVLRFNHKSFGGHLSISTNILDIGLEELYHVLQSKINSKAPVEYPIKS